jgi:DNA-binding CsgD family transcriptional regulator
MINSSEMLAFQMSPLSAAQRVADSAVAAMIADQALEAARTAVHIEGWSRIVIAAMEFCDEEAPFIRRVNATEELIHRWNPYPFDPKAQWALRRAGPELRAEIRNDLITKLLSVTPHFVKNPKPWRIGRTWIKDDNGKLAKLTLLDLDGEDSMRALRTLIIKEYEKGALRALPDSASQVLRDSGGASSEPESADPEEGNGSLEDRLGAKIGALSSREREFLELRLSAMTTIELARQMNIVPSTARVYLFRIARKLRKPM